MPNPSTEPPPDGLLARKGSAQPAIALDGDQERHAPSDSWPAPADINGDDDDAAASVATKAEGSETAAGKAGATVPEAKLKPTDLKRGTLTESAFAVLTSAGSEPREEPADGPDAGDPPPAREASPAPDKIAPAIGAAPPGERTPAQTTPADADVSPAAEPPRLPAAPGVPYPADRKGPADRVSPAGRTGKRPEPRLAAPQRPGAPHTRPERTVPKRPLAPQPRPRRQSGRGRWVTAAAIVAAAVGIAIWLTGGSGEPTDGTEQASGPAVQSTSTRAADASSPAQPEQTDITEPAWASGEAAAVVANPATDVEAPEVPPPAAEAVPAAADLADQPVAPVQAPEGEAETVAIDDPAPSQETEGSPPPASQAASGGEAAMAAAREAPKGPEDSAASATSEPISAPTRSEETAPPVLTAAEAEPVPSVDRPVPPMPIVDTPSVDVIRVEAGGSAVLAGRGKPNTDLIILHNNEPIGVTTVDMLGSWVFLPVKPLPDGPHEFTLVPKNATESIVLPPVPKSSPEGQSVVEPVRDDGPEAELATPRPRRKPAMSERAPVEPADDLRVQMPDDRHAHLAGERL